MKRIVRTLCLVLAMVLLFGLTTFAAGGNTSNDLAEIKNPATGATVVFASADSKEEKINVTYTREGLTGFYLVMMVKPTIMKEEQDDGAGNKVIVEKKVYVPNEQTIKYIDQTTAADNSITFEVYPDELVTSAILIYGTNVDGLGGTCLEAAIVEGKYILGDLTLDGKILANDGVAMSKHLAGIEALTGAGFSAADINKDGKVLANDGVQLRKYLAGLITKFEE